MVKRNAGINYQIEQILKWNPEMNRAKEVLKQQDALNLFVLDKQYTAAEIGAQVNPQAEQPRGLGFQAVPVRQPAFFASNPSS